MIPVGGRTSYLGDVLAVVVAADRASRPSARPRWSRSTTTCCRPSPTPTAALDGRRGSRCGALDANVLSVSDVRPGRASTPRWRPVGPRRARGVPDPAHRARLPRARVHAGRAPTPTACLHVYSGGQGVWDDRNQIASVLGLPTRPGHRRAGVQRRRLRRQGGHGQPGPDRAGRLAPAAAGEVHALPRGEPAHAPQAPPDPHGVPGRLRRRGPADRAAGPHDRRLGAVRLGRHEGARAGRRPRQRAVPRARPSTSSPSPSAPTTRCAAPSGASAPTRPSSPWRACSTAWPSRSASAAGRSAHRNVIQPRRRCGARARSWTTAASAPSAASTRSGPHYDARRGRGQGRRPRPRPEELRAGQRLQGDRPGRRALRGRRHRRGAPLLDRDGPGRAHRRPARSRSRSSASTRTGSGCIVDTSRELGAGQTTGSRGTLMGAGVGGRRLRRPPWPTAAGPASTTRASTGSTGRNTLGDGSSTRSSTPRSATPPSSWSSTARPGAIERGRRRPRRRPGGEPAAVRGPDRGRGAHGPRLRPHRGLPGRRPGPARPT